MSSASSTDTQTQILDAAERLFAEQGFGATSLRSIIRAADVNLAAVHYHFGSKDNLIAATIHRMAQPIVEAGVEQLATVTAQPNTLSVESILSAFFAPVEVICQAKGERGRIQARLMGRCRTEPAIEPIAEEAFAMSQQVFLAAFQEALPQQSEAEIRWKFDLLIAMLIRVLCAAGRPNAVLQGYSPAEIEAAIQRLVKFAAAGIRA
ncbi:MAG: TetR/AcrR family transcriptional regulator [Leptolyngbyaceae cyanobacterium SM1_1_3]|nr:TetR/AcrR family transcriptional regulator [Leptolyngbyaceae cyanobacterium SM1_1_3]NJO08760.1 TetR/AcrR family transcriptional regulator [Leptolyngbyaceae cyanobacterium SL_1_1]